MSVFRCGSCGELRDADFHGCGEHPFDDKECICESCEEEYACFNCGVCKFGMQYCKITDQYYCEGCV